MTTTLLYALGSVIVVSLISLIGILTLSVKENLLQKSILVLVSLAVGALFGDAIIHLIPEALESFENTATASLFILLGILIFFVLEKFLRWRHTHGAPDEHKHFTNEEGDQHIHPIGPLVLISDGVHNLLDGIIIGASYFISIEVGIATTIAIILHEIPQEIGDFALLIHAGFSKTKALLLNFLSALFALAGVAIVFISTNASVLFIPAITAVAAGSFLYIAGSDLVPELHKTSNVARSLGQFIAILVGIGLMFALLFLEIPQFSR